MVLIVSTVKDKRQKRITAPPPPGSRSSKRENLVNLQRLRKQTFVCKLFTVMVGDKRRKCLQSSK